MTDIPGPGDEETWGAYNGHPNDPRAQDDEQKREDEDQRIKDDLFANDAELYCMIVDFALDENQAEFDKIVKSAIDKTDNAATIGNKFIELINAGYDSYISYNREN